MPARASIESLRAQLKTAPGDWGCRLVLAEELSAAGASQQAALLISTAPGLPANAVDQLRAANLALSFNPSLSLQLADKVLAADESNVTAILLKARIHQHRGEIEEAHRFAQVASLFDPSATTEEADLLKWLAEHGREIPLPSTRSAKPPIVKVMEPSAPAHDEPTPVLAVEDETEPTLVIMDEDEAQIIAATPIVDDSEPEPQPVPAVKGPAERRLALPKLSAAMVAIAIHVGLIVLLGLIVVVVPTLPTAELVGITAPETIQDQPETKKVTPVAMPTPTAVVGSPARAITATGISSVALPDFESKAEGPIVTEIATTDLGASFALPFSPKGTSNVNFFGIKSKGRRVAFLIDAERYMLTDPRGGYPAYEIVKGEIASMIGKLGLETFFNVILYEGRNISAFSEKLLPATAANKAKISDWLYPVNREFTKLGLQAIGYPIHQPNAEVEPVKNNYLSGYLRAIQYALETDVDAVFVVSSGYRSMEVPRTPEERAKILKQLRWTDKDDQAWRDAIKKGQDWLNKENAARRTQGVPERVIVNIGEVWRDMGFRPPRSPPGGIQITAEEREDQIKNAIRLYYQSKDKPKPQINFVIFIGKDQDEKTVPRLDHFENIAQRARNGKVRVLQGLAALKNVSGK